MKELKRLFHTIGKKVVVIRPNQQDVSGWLGYDTTPQYVVWDTGTTLRFNDDEIDFVEINFIHLKAPLVSKTLSQSSLCESKALQTDAPPASVATGDPLPDFKLEGNADDVKIRQSIKSNQK